MNVGAEWLIDAAGCDAGPLASVEVMRTLFARLLRELDLHALHEPQFHAFPSTVNGMPGGVTGFVMLTESHLAVHTYPEHGIATFNLYCCRPRPEWPWRERLAEALGATDVTVRSVERAAQGVTACR
jgi:S-adenosylmethionine decarboxylase